MRYETDVNVWRCVVWSVRKIVVCLVVMLAFDANAFSRAPIRAFRAPTVHARAPGVPVGPVLSPTWASGEVAPVGNPAVSTRLPMPGDANSKRIGWDGDNVFGLKDRRRQEIDWQDWMERMADALDSQEETNELHQIRWPANEPFQIEQLRGSRANTLATPGHVNGRQAHYAEANLAATEVRHQILLTAAKVIHGVETDMELSTADLAALRQRILTGLQVGQVSIFCNQDQVDVSLIYALGWLGEMCDVPLLMRCISEGEHAPDAYKAIAQIQSRNSRK